jgi:hypothetical protein
MKGGCRQVLDTQLLAQDGPYGRGELQSEVSCVGTPYLEINPAMRVSAHVAAAMSHMGNTSSQRKNQTKMLIFSPKSFFYLALKVAPKVDGYENPYSHNI